jgi:RHS repeat-associated protein
MYYLRARYYIPRTGRFLTADKYEGEDLAGYDCSNRNERIQHISAHHLYTYTDGSPVNLIDPTGMNSVIENALMIARSILGSAQRLVLLHGHTLAFMGRLAMTSLAMIHQLDEIAPQIVPDDSTVLAGIEDVRGQLIAGGAMGFAWAFCPGVLSYSVF